MKPLQIFFFIEYVTRVRNSGNMHLILSDKDYFSRHSGFYEFLKAFYENNNNGHGATVIYLNCPIKESEHQNKYLFALSGIKDKETDVLCRQSGLEYSDYVKFITAHLKGELK